MDILNQRILFRDRYKQYKQNHLPAIPVFFAIPTVAFHVRINTVYQNHNFIQETILLLKKNGMTKPEIAETLCLDRKLVDIVIDNNKKDEEPSTQKSIKEERKESTDFYIFYDLLTGQFIDGYMEEAMFHDCLVSLDPENLDNRNRCYKLRQDIGKSYFKRIHLLTNEKVNFGISIEPSQENITECYKRGQLFSYNMCKDPQYLGERYSIWLTLDYSVTQYNQKEFAIVNPFREGIAFSTYFTNLIRRYATDQSSVRNLQEYHEDINAVEINKQNRRMKIKTAAESDAYERLQKKYRGYTFCKDKSKNDDLMAYMVKMQAKYDFIQKNFGKKDCSQAARQFYTFANNVLEELFTITYLPYVSALYDRLKKEDFFKKIKQESYEVNKREVIERYTQGVDSVNDYTFIMGSISPDNIARTLSSKNITSEKAFKPGLKELFVINVICLYFFNDCKFKNILNTKIEYFSDTLGIILAERQQASHLYLKPDDYVKNVIKVVYQIVDIAMEVSGERKLDDASENLEDLENYVASFALDDMSEVLQESSSQLLIDAYNASDMYYSDCVIAFENTSKVMLNYIMQNINTLDQLESYLGLIPEDEDDAKLMLMENLDKIGIDTNFDRITVKVKYAKNCLRKSMDWKKASTLIFFAPLLLSVIDNMGFAVLFKKLGAGYFVDAIEAVNERGHNKISVNEAPIEALNNRYIEYCRILTAFEREEL